MKLEDCKFDRKPGEIRADGYVFQGYNKKDGRIYEHWISPNTKRPTPEQKAEYARRRREKRKRDPERLKQFNEYHRLNEAKRREQSPERFMLMRAKNRAKKRGLPFDLTVDDIFIPSHCPVIGIELKKGSGAATDASPELDRIRPEQGYVKGNVIVVSRKVNRIKRTATPEELRKIADFYCTE